ncbi:MAG: hypothetical protein N3G80_04335 [Candidatus Micrarchaeota archaeon]|nr:hypothetical protein [Candidatus Micrarchaeota archaeon]
MGVRMRGQGATEYLVLLAVVLIIALVSIALLGFFPGLASDAKITQSNTYWRGEAMPFSIIEHSFDSSGNGSIVITNRDASGTLTITNITVGNATYSTPTVLAPGDQKVIPLSGAGSGSAGGTYEFDVKISYTSIGGLPKTQTGKYPLIGKFYS